jgi:hypothetical protein
MTEFLARWPRLRGLVVLSAVLSMLHISIVPALAQRPDDPAPPPDRVFSMRDLERLVAPIALYPDDLLTHVLMAATYPYEIVLAQRWRARNPDAKGRELEEELEDQAWDASVKAVTAFPQVLSMMSEKLDWTQELGEAFLAQPDDVFAAVQNLRARAETAGNLKTGKEFRVRHESDGPRTIYIIEPYEPTLVYVPVYDPLVVYGGWPYPDYPPYYWYPRVWRPGPVFWFGTAVVTGAALWAYWDWRRRSVIVRPTLYNTFLKTKVAAPVWRFNPVHRKGVAFKAPVLTKKFGPIAPATTAQRRILDQRLKTLPKSGFVPPSGGKAPLTKTPLTTTPLTKGAPKAALPKGTVSKTPPLAPKLERKTPSLKSSPNGSPSTKTFSKSTTKSLPKASSGVPQIKKSAPKTLTAPKPSGSSNVRKSTTQQKTIQRAKPAQKFTPAKKAPPNAKVLKKKDGK